MIFGGQSFQKKHFEWFFLAIILLVSGVFLASQQDQGPLKYEISVEAMLVPLFAVDSQGNPVYDIEANEMELQVNGEPLPIRSFKRYEFTDAKKITQKIKTGSPTAQPTAQKKPKRVFFIIIDQVFNSGPGIRRAKKIAEGLVKQGTPNDHFVIVSFTEQNGLKHLIGPENDHKQLLKSIRKIVPQPSTWIKKLYNTQDLTNITGGNYYKSPAGGASRGLDKIQYQNLISRFSHVLKRFKYALKIITEPKIVFLISEGVANGAILENFRLYLFKYFKQVVESVNRGGSVLYAINPQDIISSLNYRGSGDMSLQYMARESGGRYFSGSDTAKIITEIKKTTAAYYELAFLIPQNVKDQLDLKIECKREGVRVYTLNHSERSIPYIKMESVQKKIFALNVATGGKWSRLMGQVVKARFKIKKKDQDRVIQLNLPESLKNRTLDIFSLKMNPGSGAVDIDYSQLSAKSELSLAVRHVPQKLQYIVVIEPVSTTCLYDKIE